MESIPGIRRATWSYDDKGQATAVSITWIDGETVTVTDPAAITALSFGGVQEQVWSYDATGVPDSVRITSDDGETVTVTEPAVVAALAGR